jgi:GDP-4-dehydro-6-deoxy-D-mannose reductase
MRVLVTGAGGFAGKHVLADLARHGHDTVALFHRSPADAGVPAESLHADVTDPAALADAVAASAADACIHLAAVTFVPDGTTDPARMFSVNLMGTLHLLEAFREHRPEARILVVSTSHVYGTIRRERPVCEDDPLIPQSLYAVSKAAADQTALEYAGDFEMNVITARPQNHIGPGQDARFVVPAFATQLKAIAAGSAEPELRVGNLESEREFLHVHDVVRAYRLLLENGTPGEAYNIARGRPVAIGEILNTLCRIAGVEPEVKTDTDIYRPADSCPLLDIAKIDVDARWRPEIDMETTLRDVYKSAPGNGVAV